MKSPAREKITKEKTIICVLCLISVLLFASVLFLLYRNNYFAVFKQMTNDTSYAYENNAQYVQRQTLFEILPKEEADVVFLGDSITARSEWQEFFPDKKILNRGIDSDVTEGVLNRLEVVKEARPKQIFLMIGINDIAQHIKPEATLSNYEQIITRLSDALPDTEIFVQSLLPIGDNTGLNNKDVESMNTQIKALADKYELTYMDLYSLLIDETGWLPDSYSVDGVHLTGSGYQIWLTELRKYI